LFQGAILSDQPRQPLRSAAAGKESEGDFGLAELRGVDRDPDRASHRGLATAAERKAVDCGDHGLAEILDEIEDLLPEPAGLLRLEGRDVRELADVGAGDERLVAGARQDDAAHGNVVARRLEGCPQILPRRRVQRVEHLGPIDGHIRDVAFFLVEDIRERQCCRWRGCRRRRECCCCRGHVCVSYLEVEGEPGEGGCWPALAHTNAPRPVMALPTIRFCI
jgi:hypothetical protein